MQVIATEVKQINRGVQGLPTEVKQINLGVQDLKTEVTQINQQGQACSLIRKLKYHK